MKATISFTLVLFLTCGLAQGQNFEGSINYKQDIVLGEMFAKNGIKKEQIIEQMKEKKVWTDTVVVYYNGKGDYRRNMGGKSGIYNIYKAAENKIYTFADGPASEQVSVQDAVSLDFSGKPDVPDVKIIDTTVVIHRVKCKKVLVTYKMTQMSFYFNPNELKTDPSLYSKHTSGGFADYMKVAKALPMQTSTSLFGMEMVQIYRSAKPGPVSEDLFALPELVDDESLNAMSIPGVKVMRVKK